MIVPDRPEAALRRAVSVVWGPFAPGASPLEDRMRRAAHLLCRAPGPPGPLLGLAARPPSPAPAPVAPDEEDAPPDDPV